MDVELEGALFIKRKSYVRKEYEKTLFAEFSIKQMREVWIYTALTRDVWIQLEADPKITDYNEAPLPISIPHDHKVIRHSFAFGVRTASGITVIDVIRSNELTEDEESYRMSIERWAEGQSISYRRIGRQEIASNRQLIASQLEMLRFVLIARNARDIPMEERVDLAIARITPLVQHSFCKFVTCWFCEAVSAVAMRARSARRAKDGTALRRNPGRRHPQAISSGHSYPFPRRSRPHGTTHRAPPPGRRFCGSACQRFGRRRRSPAHPGQ